MSYLLIITTEDMKPCFNNYIQFKRSNGFEVELKTVEVIEEQSKDIQNTLDSVPSEKGDFFVLFGGLTSDVPTKFIQENSMQGNPVQGRLYASDSAYNLSHRSCQYFIGRFPTNVPAQMETLCIKAIEFASSRLTRNVMLIAGEEADIKRHQSFIPELNGKGFNTISKSLPADHDSIIRQAINQDCIYYSGHGAPGGWMPNIDSTDFIPFTKCCHIIGLCCASGRYYDTLSFGPKMLIEKKLASYLGASSYSVSTGDIFLEKELLNNYMNANYATIGESYIRAICKAASADTDAKWNIWNYNLLGDPTLPLY